MMSDDVSSLTSPEELHLLSNQEWSSLQAHQAADFIPATVEPASKGPQKSEIQLRYFLLLVSEKTTNSKEIVQIRHSNDFSL